MRPRETCLVVAFETTTQALTMEEAAREAGLEGRLIPVPRVITAGCGLAWRTPLVRAQETRDLLQRRQLAFQGCYELEI